MMKPRSSRVMGEQVASSSRMKAETLAANGAANQQAAAQARKRRSSINVYDQPSSLNSRLRQLETDMLRLDEDRTKLFDDTHSALAQYELKLGEIHAILKSRQDNVEKYVEDMKLLLQAKEEFEKQTKLLNEKHDRIHEKFMHRETIISREIKLLKNKFEILEKNRHFRSMLQKSNQMIGGDNTNDDLSSGLEGSSELSSRKRSETATIHTSDLDSARLSSGAGGTAELLKTGAAKSVRIKMSKLSNLSSLLAPIFGSKRRRRAGGGGLRSRRKSNKISSITEAAQASEASSSALGAEVAGQSQTGTPSFHIDTQQEAMGSGELTEAGSAQAQGKGHTQAQLPPPNRAGLGFLSRLFK